VWLAAVDAEFDGAAAGAGLEVERAPRGGPGGAAGEAHERVHHLIAITVDKGQVLLGGHDELEPPALHMSPEEFGGVGEQVVRVAGARAQGGLAGPGDHTLKGGHILKYCYSPEERAVLASDRGGAGEDLPARAVEAVDLDELERRGLAGAEHPLHPPIPGPKRLAGGRPAGAAGPVGGGRADARPASPDSPGLLVGVE
jgi:hypothetical protein